MMKFSKRVKAFLTVSVLSGLSITFLAFDNPSQRFFDISKNLEIFSSVYNEVNRYYVDDIDPNVIMRKGIDSMLKSLDPYTNYIPEDDIEDFQFISTGQYGGIGSVVGTKNGRVLILMPYKGFPADKAGLKIGDEIVEVDGENVQGKTTSEVSKFLKGQANTEIKLKIKRYGEKELLSITLKRDKIQVKSVPYYGMVNDEIGYFCLTSFTNGASKEIKKALESLKNDGAKKIIFDLRDNGGGLLKEAIQISNLFIPKGKEVVSTRGKVEKWNVTYNTESSSFDEDIPIAILVNGRSASASEIVSGVIQDYDRGILVGRQTYGKGLVQATFDIAHRSKVKITTAKYYIPSGRCIQAIDYSKRNKDGKAQKVPDSLLVEFKTKNGRVVYDGQGVTPDVKITKDDRSPLMRALLGKHMLFNYAVKYHYEHKEIAPALEFKLTHEDYIDFKNWLDTQDFEYEIALEKRLESFEKQIEKDSIEIDMKDEITHIKEKITEIKKVAFEKFENEILQTLEVEIAGHYYYQNGIIEASFDNDKDVKKAIHLLNDQEAFNKILQP